MSRFLSAFIAAPLCLAGCGGEIAIQTASSRYSSPIFVSATTTIEAIAVASMTTDLAHAVTRSDTNSAVATGVYKIAMPSAAPAPTFSPTPGTYTSAQAVTLTDGAAGAAIYYTTDGSTPTTASTRYSSPISVPASATIEAIAVASGCASSAVTRGTYEIAAPAPTFSPAPGSYSSAQSVALADGMNGTAIFYTTDGSAPTASSTLYTSPISVSADTTIQAIAMLGGAHSQSAVATGAYLISGPAVSVVLSTHDRSSLMAAQPSVQFTASSPGGNELIIDENLQYQSIDGFGAAFTDSAAFLLSEVAESGAQSKAMSDLFTRDGNGIGLSFMRIPMGASDLARSVYSFDDQALDHTDLPLANFSIAHDQAYILPIILQAKALNPQMKLMANPWSPPAWMKDPASMKQVSMLGGSLLMTPANETAFANYFVNYLRDYKAAGIPIDYISLQNEPLYVPTSYPSMGMSATNQLTLLRDYVLPALASSGLSTQVLVYDHN